jgi:hypothetical protein
MRAQTDSPSAQRIIRFTLLLIATACHFDAIEATGRTLNAFAVPDGFDLFELSALRECLLVMRLWLSSPVVGAAGE